MWILAGFVTAIFIGGATQQIVAHHHSETKPMVYQAKSLDGVNVSDLSGGLSS